MLTDQQKQVALAIVNIFETGKVEGDYGNVTLIKGDSGHLTYGSKQTTLGSDNLYTLLRDYCAAPNAQYAAGLGAYLPTLKALKAERNKDARLKIITPLDQDENLNSLLRKAGADPVMQTTQDAFFEDVYWVPASNAAQQLGCSLPLSFAVVFDSHIHGSWKAISEKTHSNVGQTKAIGEKAWIAGYVKTRHEWLANHSNKVLHNTVYRMKAFQQLIQADNWRLELPITVHGVTIQAEMFKPALPALKVVLLADNSVVPCHPQVENGKTRVDMRALCEAMKVALPTGEALAALNPVVIPPGVTRVDLRPLAENNGWELLTHKMAEDSKIYLNKRA